MRKLLSFIKKYNLTISIVLIMATLSFIGYGMSVITLAKSEDPDVITYVRNNVFAGVALHSIKSAITEDGTIVEYVIDSILDSLNPVDESELAANSSDTTYEYDPQLIHEIYSEHHEEAKKEAKNKPGALFLNWDEVAQMSDIISFHSHTHGHTDGYFGSLPFKQDLELCKNTIKTRLGFDDTHLCWPRGQFDDERLKIAKNIGYKVFYTTIRGSNLIDNKLDEIKRIDVNQ